MKILTLFTPTTLLTVDIIRSHEARGDLRLWLRFRFLEELDIVVEVAEA